MRTIASMVRKRDITAFWELDPLAAPPKSMQNQLRGALVAEPDLHEEDGEESTDDALEQISILEIQLRYAMRRNETDRVRAISRELRELEDAKQQQELCRAQTNGELRVGDPCFVLGKIVEWEWYRARLIGIRTRYPTLRVEYLSTLEGDPSNLALPQPKVNHVPLEHVRLDAPEDCVDVPITPPNEPCVKVIEPPIAEFS